MTGENFYTDSPYNLPAVGALMYSLITYGYHLEELVDLVFFQEPSNDYYEMLLHHLATVVLYLGMIGNNSLNAASMCAWFHTIADVFVYTTKILSQTTFSKLSYFPFALMILSWFWTRLVVVQWFAYATFKFYTFPPQFAAYESICTIMTLLGFILCMLHFYWFFLFMKILHAVIFKGNTEDLIHKTGK